MEQPRQVLVPTYRGVKDILGCYAQRQLARIGDFQPIWVKIQENVAPLSMGR